MSSFDPSASVPSPDVVEVCNQFFFTLEGCDRIFRWSGFIWIVWVCAEALRHALHCSDPQCFRPYAIYFKASGVLPVVADPK